MHSYWDYYIIIGLHRSQQLNVFYCRYNDDNTPSKWISVSVSCKISVEHYCIPCSVIIMFSRHLQTWKEKHQVDKQNKALHASPWPAKCTLKGIKRGLDFLQGNDLTCNFNTLIISITQWELSKLFRGYTATIVTGIKWLCITMDSLLCRRRQSW